MIITVRSLWYAARSTCALLAVASGVGCWDDRVAFWVDLRTDFVPGSEFATVETETEAPGNVRHAPPFRATVFQQFDRGVRVAVFDEMTRSTTFVRMTLVDRAGAPIATRRARVQLDYPSTYTMLVTRACRDVSCPGPADPADATECLGARCVTPACVPGYGCTVDGCARAADCPSGAGCASPGCVDGVCWLAPDRDRCAPLQYCHVAVGCLDLYPDPDSGTADIDGGAEPDASAP